MPRAEVGTIRQVHRFRRPSTRPIGRFDHGKPRTTDRTQHSLLTRSQRYDAERGDGALAQRDVRGRRSALYKDLSRLIKQGVEEGWAANQEVDGPNYRRSRILEPTPETFHFSITAVYMNSTDARRFKGEDDHDVLRGQYHGHPYGELNLVVPLDKGAELKGLQGWQGAGWTAPRSRQPALSRGEGRRCDRVILSAGRTNLVRLQGSGLIADSHIHNRRRDDEAQWQRPSSPAFDALT